MKTITTALTALILFSSAAYAAPAADAALMAKGKTVYEKNCAACHGKNGEGRAPVFPPLTKADYIEGKPQVLAKAIVKGIRGPITVNGKPYNGIMPFIAMSDADAAALSTFVMNAFNNGGGTITEKDIKQARSQK